MGNVFPLWQPLQLNLATTCWPCRRDVLGMPSVVYWLLGNSVALGQWFSKWMSSPYWGDFEGKGGEQTKGVIGGSKQCTGGENAQRGFYHFPHHIWLKRDFRLWPQCSQSKKIACWFISKVIYGCTSLKCLSLNKIL